MQILVEVIANAGEPSVRALRVRPVSGQFEREYRVWCSVSEREAKSMRGIYRVGATWVTPKSRERYLRVSLHEPWVPVTASRARAILANSGSRASQVGS